jgi:hypothetical protein
MEKKKTTAVKAKAPKAIKAQNPEGQQQENPNLRLAQWCTMDDVRRECIQFSELTTIPISSSHDAIGSWCYKDSKVWPEKVFDFNGKSVGSTNYGYEGDDFFYRAITGITHSGEAGNVPANVAYYDVTVTLKRCDDCYTNDDGGKKREWYLEHGSGYFQDGQAVTTDVTRNPERNHEASIENWGWFEPNHVYTMRCYPGGACGWFTRPIEQDDNDPDTRGDTLQCFKVFCGLMYDFTRMIMTGGFVGFALEVVGLIRALIQSTKDDDPLNPCIMVLSDRACQYISTMTDGTWEMNRYVHELNTWVQNTEAEGTPNTPGFHQYRPQIFSYTTNMHMKLHYQVKVTPHY